MTNKKTAKADLENKKYIFFQIGLLIAISSIFLVLETGVKITKKQKANHYSEIELTVMRKTNNNTWKKAISPEINFNLIKFIQHEIRISDRIGKQNTKGIIYVEFATDTKNKIISVKLLNKIRPDINKEAIRIANKIPQELLIGKNQTNLKPKILIPFVFK